MRLQPVRHRRPEMPDEIPAAPNEPPPLDPRHVEEDRLDHTPPQPRRDLFVKTENLLLDIARIAGEDLVAAIAREKPRYPLLARGFGAIIGRHDRRISERLVEDARDLA